MVWKRILFRSPKAKLILQWLSLRFWGIGQIIRLGIPARTIGFFGGIGDDLLCTCALEEWLDRGARNIWFFTRHPELYLPCDPRVRLVPEDGRYLKLAELLRTPFQALAYSTYDVGTDRDSAPNRHLILEMCIRASLKGKIRLRPLLRLTASEMEDSKQWGHWIAIQTSTLHAVVPMLNKQWKPERFQEVANHFAGRIRFVQIGSISDPSLQGVKDMRGKTTLRETAVLLAGARVFLGLAGFLMHLARAVDCPSVIVYGGRELPALTGYNCNINLVNQPACSPCWQRNLCDNERVCLNEISTLEVIAAIEISLTKNRAPLKVEEAII